MKKLDNAKPFGFSSNNIIPKEVRKLFQKKCKLSKELRNVTSIKRCSNIWDSILNIDIQLKNHYEDRRHIIEEKLFNKSKKNKNIMYHHIKRVQKLLSKISPFLKDSKLIDDKPCEILKQQYEHVFSIPFDPQSFFKPEQRCMDCKKTSTHTYVH